MSPPGSNRLLVLGVDGLAPTTLDRFREEGILHTWDALHAAAARLSVIPTLPPLTAPGWMTIGSGAHPSTLGVTSILQPKRGAPPDQVANSFDRRGVAADYLWDDLAKAGECAIVVKYPGSWPPRTPGVVQVDGAGGYADITCRFDVVSSLLYSSDSRAVDLGAVQVVPGGYAEHWRIDSGVNAGTARVIPREALGWSGLAPGFTPAFEAVLPVSGRRGERSLLTVVAGLERPEGPPVLLVSRNKRIDGGTEQLRVREWSGWIHDTIGGTECCYRLKLLELDLEARTLRVYRSAGHARAGFTQPATLAAELEAAAGPVVEWTGTFDFMNGLIDLETQLEIYDQHTAWLERCLEYLTEHHPWRALFVQWHVVEYAHHIAGSALSVDHPHHKVRKDEFLGFLRETYRLGDRLVATARRLTGEPDTLAVVSDHGHALVHTLFFINALLLEEGLLSLDEHAAIDWTHTSAYGLYPGFIVLNSADRWAGGIVSAKDAPSILRRIVQLLRSVQDPRTGERPVSALIPRSEMDAWGQDGPHAPDLYFAMDEGYEVASRLILNGPLFRTTVPGEELTSGHGSFHPHSPAARTLALFEGPSFEPGSRGAHPVNMVDLAPTFAAILGCPPPRDSDGQPINLSRLGVARGQV